MDDDLALPLVLSPPPAKKDDWVKLDDFENEFVYDPDKNGWSWPVEVGDKVGIGVNLGVGDCEGLNSMDFVKEMEDVNIGDEEKVPDGRKGKDCVNRLETVKFCVSVKLLVCVNAVVLVKESVLEKDKEGGKLNEFEKYGVDAKTFDIVKLKLIEKYSETEKELVSENVSDAVNCSEASLNILSVNWPKTTCGSVL